jgi:hypothetical protein
LKGFARAKGLTAANLAATVQRYPRYYANIRPNTLRLSGDEALLDRIRENYRRIGALYPESVFPPLTFILGRFTNGGTVAAEGMMIGAEFYGVGPGTPLDELPRFPREVVQPLDAIPVIVAHEHVHVLQLRAGGVWTGSKQTLLELALMEGSADFVSGLVAGTHSNADLWAYAILHEGEIWEEFRHAMYGTDIGQWLYNRASATGERPGDLGYFVGYRIAEAYYARASDKRSALRDIIEMKNAAAFLAASGYTGGG